MKIHPGLLAIVLLAFAVLACSGSDKNSSNTSTKSSGTTGPGEYVSDIYMSKDKDGSKMTSFSPSDKTIYCIVELKDGKSGTPVKFTWTGVDVGSSKNEKIKDLEYTTGENEDKVFGHLTYPQDWPTGLYRVDVYVNGKLDKTIEYTIK